RLLRSGAIRTRSTESVPGRPPMKTLRVGCLLAAVGIAAAGGGTLVQSAPAIAATKRNPLETDERAKRAGAKLFARECASCHGLKGEGRRHAPPLRLPEV